MDQTKCAGCGANMKMECSMCNKPMHPEGDKMKCDGCGAMMDMKCKACGGTGEPAM